MLSQALSIFVLNLLSPSSNLLICHFSAIVFNLAALTSQGIYKCSE